MMRRTVLTVSAPVTGAAGGVAAAAGRVRRAVSAAPDATELKKRLRLNPLWLSCSSFGFFIRRSSVGIIIGPRTAESKELLELYHRFYQRGLEAPFKGLVDAVQREHPLGPDHNPASDRAACN